MSHSWVYIILFTILHIYNFTHINFLKFITVSALILVVFLSCHCDGRFRRRRLISLFDSLQESSKAVLQQGHDGIPQNDSIIST